MSERLTEAIERAHLRAEFVTKMNLAMADSALAEIKRKAEVEQAIFDIRDSLKKIADHFDKPDAEE